MDIAEVLKHTSPDLFLPDIQTKDKQGTLAALVDGLIATTNIKNASLKRSGGNSMTKPSAFAIGSGANEFAAHGFENTRKC